MNLHSLKNTRGAKKRRMRVGRGESSGKGRTSGKGNKGQMSRTGHKHKPLFEGGQMKLIRRIPKRGFTPAALVAAGRIGPKSLVKILGGGEVGGARKVVAHAFSASAKAKIEQAGGTCETIS